MEATRLDQEAREQHGKAFGHGRACPSAQREQAAQRRKRDIKKGSGVLCKEPAVRYAFIHEEQQNHSIKTLCALLKVSKSGYYKWLGRPLSERAKRRCELQQSIELVHEQSRRNYGSPRVHKALANNGVKVNKKTVADIMRKAGIRAKSRRKFKATTDSNHELPIAPNLLDRQFHKRRVNDVWVSDITYIDTAEGWLYLAVFIDLGSRKVVGWSMDSTMTTELVLNAFRMGISNAGRPPNMVHSDRGCQYASDMFVAELKLRGCIQSMSRKGNCWDNAVAESFFGSLKREAVYHYRFNTRQEAKACIFDYVEAFYNRFRLHSALGYLTPVEKGQKGQKAA
jgi:putative transposase